MTDDTPSSAARGRISRRTLLAGAVAVGGPWLFAVYGRYAVGSEFEQHVADVLGIPLGTANRLIGVARDRLGTVEYDIRANAFLAATTWPGNALIPSETRVQAIRPFLEHIIDRPVDNVIYLGLREPVSNDACAGLVKS